MNICVFNLQLSLYPQQTSSFPTRIRICRHVAHHRSRTCTLFRSSTRSTFQSLPALNFGSLKDCPIHGLWFTHLAKVFKIIALAQPHNNPHRYSLCEHHTSIDCDLSAAPTLLPSMTVMSVTARVSLAAVSSARRYVINVLLLFVLFTFADRPSIVLWMTSHPDITRSFPSYNTLQSKIRRISKLHQRIPRGNNTIQRFCETANAATVPHPGRENGFGVMRCCLHCGRSFTMQMNRRELWAVIN